MYLSEDFAAVCTNLECSTNYYSSGASGATAATAGTSSGGVTVVTEYNIPVSLSDHSGTVTYCHLLPAVAETLLGCKVWLTGCDLRPSMH